MPVIDKEMIKVVKSLGVKKHRDEEGLFVAEGGKCVHDTWGAFRCKWLIATRGWVEQNGQPGCEDRLVLATHRDMARMTQFSTPSEVIAVYETPATEIDAEEVRTGLNIVLDNIQDPGNLGTIIRLADWYGIRNIFASKSSVDVYNPKVVQATMGAIARVKVHYTDLDELFGRYDELAVYGTFLDGDNIYNATLETPCFVAFGNEGQGIGAQVERYVTKRLHIPAAPHDGGCSESLNVGVAAAITISEFMREKLKQQVNGGR